MTTSVTGLKLGSAAANTTVAAGMTYGSLTNALVEDDTTATTGAVTTKNAEAHITVSNFGLNSMIPYGATIERVGLRHRGTATTGGTHEASLLLGATQGATSSGNNVALTTVFVESYARPGGGQWTRADLLNGTLTARLRSLQPNNTTSRTYQWAWVEVLVTFSDPTEDFPTPEWDPADEFLPAVPPAYQFILVNTALGVR